MNKLIIYLLFILLFVASCDRVKKLAGLKNNQDSNNPPLEDYLHSDKIKNINSRVLNLEKAVSKIDERLENNELSVNSLENRIQKIQDSFNRISKRSRRIVKKSSRPKKNYKKRKAKPKIVNKRRYKKKFYIQIGAYKIYTNAVNTKSNAEKNFKIEFQLKETKNYYDGDIEFHLKNSIKNVFLYKVISKKYFNFSKANKVLRFLKANGYRDACLIHARN